MAKVENAWFYAALSCPGSCPFCRGSKSYGGLNGLDYICPECDPLFRQDMAAGKVHPKLKGTGVRFDFERWAILKRAESDAAEAGQTLEQAKELVDGIAQIWLNAHETNQRLLRQEEAQAAARRASIASRSTY